MGERRKNRFVDPSKGHPNDKFFRFLAEDVCEDLSSVLDGIQYNWGNRA